MPELRWILLGLGAAFCLGLWWWETRRRGQAADALREFDEPRGWDEGPAVAPAPARRIEPTFGEAPETSFDERDYEDLSDEPMEEFADQGDERGHHSQDQDEPETPEETPAPSPDRIVSMRLFCAPDQPFEGRELVEALQAEGLEHGQFSIFHRHDHSGRRLFSVASLLEPGSFDLDHIDGVPFKGVVFFAVQQEAGEEGLADMRRTAQALAGRLNGNLTTER